MMTTTITTTVTGAGMNIIGTGMPTVIIAINGGTTTVQLVAFQQVHLSSDPLPFLFLFLSERCKVMNPTLKGYCISSMESPPVQDKAFVRGGAPLSLLPFVANALLCKMQVLNKGLAMRSHEFSLRLTIAEFQIPNKKNHGRVQTSMVHTHAVMAAGARAGAWAGVGAGAGVGCQVIQSA